MYKIKCSYCQEDMEYVEDVVLEAKGYISMDCPKCKSEFLVPKDNPDLEKIETKEGD